MNKKLFSVLIGIPLISVFNVPAYSATIGFQQELYQESNNNFNWRFVLTNVLGDVTSFQSFVPTGGSGKWSPSIEVGPIFGNPAEGIPISLTFDVKHTSIADSGDASESSSCCSGDVRIDTLEPKSNFTQLISDSAQHIHTPDPNHSDFYKLIYKGNPSESLTFELSGKHVPEPLTTLSSITALGIGVQLKRQYSKKLKKATSKD